MKKRSCRVSETEKLEHEQAVKLRKMTDQQLIQYINKIQTDAYDEGLETGKRESTSIEKFVKHLDELSGTGNGLGKVTMNKLKKFAKEEGYLGV